MSLPDSSASPLKSALEEVDNLTKTFESTLEAYRANVAGDLAEIRERVASEAGRKRRNATVIRDARDLLAVIRLLEVKPEKGRRRDLKKIEAVIEDLQQITRHWSE